MSAHSSDVGSVLIYDSPVTAATPARAICSSWADCTPETPTAPTQAPSLIIGTPPCNRTNGAESKLVRALPSLTLTRLSSGDVSLPNRAAERALPIATSAVAAEALRWRSRGVPPASQTTMVTFQSLDPASASAAAITFLAPAEVSAKVGTKSTMLARRALGHFAHAAARSRALGRSLVPVARGWLASKTRVLSSTTCMVRVHVMCSSSCCFYATLFCQCMVRGTNHVMHNACLAHAPMSTRL